MLITNKAIKLIVGLRNPGVSYSKTRHNVGCWFVEAVAHQENLSFKQERKFKGDITTITSSDVACNMLLPSTFMNNSGESVRAVCNFYKISSDEILVIHDDLDLQPGVIKLKFGGGHAGHNGLRDIISHLQTKDFHRMRIGIGHPGQRELVVDYVLGKPSPSDKEQIDSAIVRSLNIFPLVISGDFAQAMQELH